MPGSGSPTGKTNLDARWRLNSLADAWKMLAMSAARLCTTRLAPLIALAALSLIAGCTAPTPLYCSHPGTIDCDPGYSCDITIHTCKPGSTGVDANDAAAGDAPADAPTDAGTNEDHPASADGPRGDASDGSADVFHGCVNNSGCSDSTKPVCQTDGGVCVGCLQNSDCKAAAAPACDITANKCVECVVNGDCTNPTKPVCDNQACRRCAADSECAGIGPGVCMFHLDGHCATDSETVYVVPSSPNCADDVPTSGTIQKPFCHSQPAIDATAPLSSGNADGGAADAAGTGPAGDGGVPQSAKTLVVMRGPSLNQWSLNDAGRTITVVGQLGATLVPGVNIGIHISAGTVYIRSLRINGMNVMSTDPAIVADGSSVLHLDRSMVDGNAKGGILINGAAYDITNTVIANNGISSTVCGAWGGVCIASPSSALRRFLNNTVVGNTPVGVACATVTPPAVPPTVLGSIVTAPDGGLPTSQCDFTACCGNGPVGVDPTTFHLMAGSSCIDQLAANMSTPYDFDGTPRPVGSFSDCGAFEYIAPMP